MEHRDRPRLVPLMIFAVGVVLALFVFPDGMEIPVIAGFAVLEIVETTITWRLSRMWAPRFGPETLIGTRGRAVTACRPAGTVRVQNEEWQARCDVGVDADQPVRVVAREGLTLLVEPVEEARPA
jgi:membrane-bound serine protease (ClpP class)